MVATGNIENKTPEHETNFPTLQELNIVKTIY